MDVGQGSDLFCISGRLLEIGSPGEFRGTIGRGFRALSLPGHRRDKFLSKPRLVHRESSNPFDASRKLQENNSAQSSRMCIDTCGAKGACQLRLLKRLRMILCLVVFRICNFGSGAEMETREVTTLGYCEFVIEFGVKRVCCEW